MEHFAIAARWPVSPREVLEEWDEELVGDALQVMNAEARRQQMRQREHGNG